MQKFEKLTSVAAPLPMRDVDTDQIFPSRFQSRNRADGKFGDYFLHDQRFDGEGRPKADCILNDERLRGARILVAGANYACGSARPGAIYSHLDFGIRAIIAESFGAVFPTVAFKSGLLTVQLDAAHTSALRSQLLRAPGAEVAVDLEDQVVVAPDGQRFGFDIDPFAKRMLLEGIDEIDLTLKYVDEIQQFEARRRAAMPWVF